MQQGDIIRITDVQTLTNYVNPILNVYHYQVFSITQSIPLQVYADDIAEAFKAAVLDRVLDVQVNSVTHTELQFWNLSDQLEIATHTWQPPLQGNIVGEYAPANLSYSFRLNRFDRITRNGRKSVSGVPELASIGGRLLSPAFATVVSNLAAALGTFFPVEGDTTDSVLSPVIVRMPANEGVAPSQYSAVNGAVFRGFGTQNSRKAL